MNPRNDRNLYTFTIRVVKIFKADTAFLCCFLLSFQYNSKLLHWLLWKCCVQLLYFIFSVLYKVVYIVLTKALFQWSRTSTKSKVMYTNHLDSAFMLIFSAYGVLPLTAAFISFTFFLYCSSIAFNILSKCTYIANGTNWY